MWLCYHDNIDLHQTGSVGEGSNHLQLIKFWPSHAPGKGICSWTKIFVSALRHAARSVCVFLSAFFCLYIRLCSAISIQPNTNSLLYHAIWQRSEHTKRVFSAAVLSIATFWLSWTIFSGIWPVQNRWGLLEYNFNRADALPVSKQQRQGTEGSY